MEWLLWIFNFSTCFVWLNHDGSPDDGGQIYTVPQHLSV